MLTLRPIGFQCVGAWIFTEIPAYKHRVDCVYFILSAGPDTDTCAGLSSVEMCSDGRIMNWKQSDVERSLTAPA